MEFKGSSVSHAYFESDYAKEIGLRKKRNSKSMGCQTSELVRLPYLDLIRYHIVDPMHNLLLGTANYMYRMSVLKDESSISKSDYQNMQDTVDRIRVPVNIGRQSRVSSIFSDS